MDLTTLYKVSYGLYVVSAAADDRLNGHIANTVFQISNEPPTIAVSTNKQNFTHDLIVSSGKFAVSILAESTPMELIQKFGFKTGRDIDKLASTSYRIGATGAPIVLDHTIGFLEAEVVDSLDAGTHTVFLGRIVASENLTNEPPKGGPRKRRRPIRLLRLQRLLSSRNTSAQFVAISMIPPKVIRPIILLPAPFSPICPTAGVAHSAVRPRMLFKPCNYGCHKSEDSLIKR